jgi:hypothetical protein
VTARHGPPGRRSGRPPTGDRLDLTDSTPAKAPEVVPSVSQSDPRRWRRWHVDVPARRRTSRELRDAIGCGVAGPVAFTASDYGLTRAELIREGHRLHRHGWALDEITQVLTNPGRVPDDGWCA